VPCRPSSSFRSWFRSRACRERQTEENTKPLCSCSQAVCTRENVDSVPLSDRYMCLSNRFDHANNRRPSLARHRGEEPLDVQFLGAALRLPQIVGKLHLQPVSGVLPNAWTAAAPFRVTPSGVENRRESLARDAQALPARSPQIERLRQSSRTISPGAGSYISMCLFSCR